MAEPETPRFETCRCVIYAEVEGAPPGAAPRESGYRRCPVGVIASVDCPEFAGVRCRVYAPRGDAPRQVVSAAEVAQLRAELAADGYPSDRYLRRIRPLWTGSSPSVRGLDLLIAGAASEAPLSGASAPPEPARRTEVPVPRAAPRAPVNVPSDDAAARARSPRGRDRPPGPGP